MRSFFVATTVALLAGVCAAAPPLGYQPNIVFILTDDQDTRLGNSTEYTPLGSIAAMTSLQENLMHGGMWFPNFFVNTPICCPSRTETFTGRYFHNVIGSPACMHVVAGPNVMNTSRSMFGQLQAAGYTTGVFGKVTNDQGHAYWDPKKETTWTTDGMDYVNSPPDYNSYDPPQYFVKSPGNKAHIETINKKDPVYGFTYQTVQLGNRSLEFIDQMAQGSNPFFAYIGPHAPHYPAEPAPYYDSIYDDCLEAPRLPNYNVSSPDKSQHIRQNPPLSDEVKCWEDKHMQDRWASLRSVDDIVQGVMDVLEKRGVLDKTFIMYTSDHGYKLGSWRVGTSKQHPFDTDIRVPFFVRGPKVSPGSKSNIMGANVDLLPTMLELAGVPSRSLVDGKSFAHELIPEAFTPEEVETRSATWRQQLLHEYWSVGTYYNDHSDIWYNDSAPAFQCSGTKGPRSPPGVDPKSKCVEADGVGDGECYFVDSTHSNSWRALRVINDDEDMVYVEYDPAFQFNATSTGAGLQFYEVYDLKTDPYQMKNLYNSTDPKKLEQLHQSLAAYFTCQGSDCN